MSKLARKLWNTIKFSLLLVCPFVILHYWAAFAEKQAIVLSLLFFGAGCILLVLWRWATDRDKSDAFEPFKVEVHVTDWYDLLFKYKLVRSKNDWEQARARPDAPPLHRCVFDFTVLSRNRLFFHNDLKIFQAGRPSFSESIEKLTGFQVTDKDWTSILQPSLFFGHVGLDFTNYAMGIRVPREWWNRVKTPDLADTEVITAHGRASGLVYLVLARLPIHELGMTYEGKDIVGQQEVRSRELTKRGWTDDFQALLDSDFYRVTHAHFAILHSDIETPIL